MTDCQGEVLVSRALALGVTTVGVAEYRALIAGLSEAQSRGVDEIKVYSDSQFMCRQLQGRYRVRTPAILPLYEWAVKLRGRFRTFEICHVTRDKNKLADKLATAGAMKSAAGEKSPN